MPALRGAHRCKCTRNKQHSCPHLRHVAKLGSTDITNGKARSKRRSKRLDRRSLNCCNSCTDEAEAESALAGQSEGPALGLADEKIAESLHRKIKAKKQAATQEPPQTASNDVLRPARSTVLQSGKDRGATAETDQPANNKPQKSHRNGPNRAMFMTALSARSVRHPYNGGGPLLLARFTPEIRVS